MMASGLSKLRDRHKEHKKNFQLKHISAKQQYDEDDDDEIQITIIEGEGEYIY